MDATVALLDVLKFIMDYLEALLYLNTPPAGGEASVGASADTVVTIDGVRWRAPGEAGR